MKLKIAIATLIALACIVFMIQQANHGPDRTAKPGGRAERAKRNDLTITRSDADTTRTVARKRTPRPAQTFAQAATPGAGEEWREAEQQARRALPQVGTDEDATRTWLAAINNRNIPAITRAELIARLTEDGFSSEQDYTEEDLPLIQARLQLIERLEPEAIDQANAAAFSAAQQTLTNLEDQLGGDDNNNDQ
ncbi:hypothetical protein LLG95_01975 [bacterium]|nr:hypothetical protein [bacterium]